MYSNPHRFETYNYGTPTSCDYCSHVLWGIVKTGQRCSDCGYNCHEKCIDHVPKHCAKYNRSSAAGGSSSGASTAPTAPRPGSVDVTSVASSSSPHTSSSHQYYDQFSSNIAENRTHEGISKIKLSNNLKTNSRICWTFKNSL